MDVIISRYLSQSLSLTLCSVLGLMRASEICFKASTIPLAFYRILFASPSAFKILDNLSPSAILIVDTISPSLSNIVLLLSLSCSDYSSMAFRIYSGGFISRISYLIQVIPQCSEAEFNAYRIYLFNSALSLKVVSKSIFPISLLIVVYANLRIALTG